MTGNKNKNHNLKFMKKVMSKEDVATVAYAIHKCTKEDGQELENPSKCAKAALLALGYDLGKE